MKIVIQNKQKKIKITSQFRSMIKDILFAGIKTENISVPVEISIVLTDNRFIQELNEKYRGKSSPTDVLAFPMYDKKTIKNLIKKREPITNQGLVLGDIVISVERAQEQAAEFNHSIEREIGYLLVHGFLHLLGYDHIRKSDSQKMRQKEEEILHLVGLTRNQS